MTTDLEHARTHLADLREELAAAIAVGLADHPAYRADLREDLERAEAAYVVAAVTELAALRARLDGPLLG